ncbi:MAG: NRAMP family divalent metal transporter [Planctomycetota bacterium]
MAPTASFRASFGPGLLWAAAAIGVSHLVQSTRAGATTGFGLAGVILLALVLKYPFFEFGPRYAAATGNSLVEGYGRIGQWALWLFLLITLITAFVSQAAVVLFTTYLLLFAFRLDWSLWPAAAVLLAGCAGLLWAGRYRALDTTIKIILAVLAVSTFAAAAVTAPRADFTTIRLFPTGLVGTVVPFAFLLALVGWMPSPVDTAVWNSLWTLAKNEATGRRASVRTARQDFVIGYVGTGVLAFAFVTLGAGVMFQSDVSFSPQGTVFSTQLVDLYGRTLGTWARPIVIVAVVTTMLSTTLTVVDGFPRAIERTLPRLKAFNPGPPPVAGTTGPIYWGSIVVLAMSTVVVLALFIGNLTTMVDFATIVSFMTAPLLGYLNLRAVTSSDVPLEHRPGRAMQLLTWVGLVLLGGTGLVYLTLLLQR